MRTGTRICILAAALSVGACAFSDNIFWQSRPPEEAVRPPAAVAAMKPAPPPAAPAARAPAAAPEEARKPFLVIRFEAPDPDYGQTLYEAVSAALKRRPGVNLDLVAVTRDADAARRNLAAVMRSLGEMGMPAERLSLAAVSAADDGTDEVWIYLR